LLNHSLSIEAIKHARARTCNALFMLPGMVHRLKSHCARPYTS